MGLLRDSSNMEGGWRKIANMQGARQNQVGECMLVIMANPNSKIQTSGGGDGIGDKGIRYLVLSTNDNVHSTHINLEDQVVMELVSPITLWTIWKQC